MQLKIKHKIQFFSGLFAVLGIPLLFIFQQKISIWPIQYNRNKFYQSFLIREKIHTATLEALKKNDGWKKISAFWLQRQEKVSALTWILFGAEHHKAPQAMILLGKIYMVKAPMQARLFFEQALKSDAERLTAEERMFARNALEKLK